MSLEFVLQLMEALIVVQIEMFHGFCKNKGCVPDYLEEIKMKTWDSNTDKRELGN